MFTATKPVEDWIWLKLILQIYGAPMLAKTQREFLCHELDASSMLDESETSGVLILANNEVVQRKIHNQKPS